MLCGDDSCIKQDQPDRIGAANTPVTSFPVLERPHDPRG
jgi:hypothetical protein